MLATIAQLLIQLLGLFCAYFLIVWFIGMMHLAVPAMALTVLIVVLVLLGVWLTAKAFGL
jgi:hypothetical protein